MAAVQRFLQRRLVDQAAARAVDDPHALLGLGEVFRRQDVAGLVGQRRVQRDEIGAGQQRIEVCLLDAHFDRAFGRQERIERDDLHLQAERAAATIEPILPAPIRPSVLPVTSTPMNRFFGHLPACV
jgi:hypothetical protein